MRAFFYLAACAAVLLAIGRAAAAPSTVPSSERDELTRQIARDYEALSTSDCAVACRAFASMQRAAERLCEIDPGQVCADARAKVEEARRRIDAACPVCPKDHAAAEPPAPTPTPATAGRESVASAAPPAESKHGGCAGCASASGERGGGELGVALLLGALVLLRRPRRVRRVRRR